MTASNRSSELSISPVNGVAYDLPSGADDHARLDEFLSGNPDKPVVVVQGLGFVGAVMSIVCANADECEYAVIGVDLPTPESYWKICAINEGILPLSSSDPKVDEFFVRACKKGNLFATHDEYAYVHADIIIVDVNLDVLKQSNSDRELLGFDVNLEPISRAIESIARNCKQDVLVLVETTVPPGTCEKVLKKILIDGLAARGLPVDQFKLGHSYERVMPGPNYLDSIKNFYRVYSGIDSKSANATKKFLGTIIRTDEYPLTRLKSTTATEMAKVLENSYRAMNIAFIAEWSRFAEEAAVDLYEVINAIRMRDTHKNIMLPGIGVGGYCLTKDPLLASWARQNLFGAEEGLAQSERAVQINDRMPSFAFTYLMEQLNPRKLKGMRILLLGVTYRGDVGDTRYSPVEWFHELLIQAGCCVKAHDYFISHWNERDTDVEMDLVAALSADYDVVAITTGHSAYRNNRTMAGALARMPTCLVYDTIGLLTDAELVEIGRSNRVIVLGRGVTTSYPADSESE